jgi:hypothetical protein
MSVQPGNYLHYKGGWYRVLFMAMHTETKETLVVYISLKTGGIFARPEKMWSEEVTWPNGDLRSRFISEETASIRKSLSSSLA